MDRGKPRTTRTSYGVGTGQRVASGIFWAALFLVYPLVLNYPLLVTTRAAPNGALATVAAKAVALVALTILGILLWLITTPDLNLRDLGRRWAAQPNHWKWLTIFLIVLVASGLFAIKGFFYALQGDSVRYDGLLFELCWYLMAALAAAMVRRSGDPVPALRWAAAGGLVIAAWATLQAYGIEPFYFLNHIFVLYTYGMPAASLGHQAIVAGYLATLTVIWSAWLVLEGGRQPKRLLGSWLIPPALTVGLVASGGRAGLVAAAVLWIVFLVAWGRQKPYRMVALWVSLSLLIAGMAVALTNHHGGHRIDSLAVAARGQNPSLNHRFITWEAGLKAILHRPITGYGPDAFAIEVWKYTSPAQARRLFTEFIPKAEAAHAVRKGTALVYVNPKIHRVGVLNMNYDKAHNYFIDLGVASGVVALALFIGYLLSSWRFLLRYGGAFGIATTLAILTFLLFAEAWFYTIDIDPMIWGLLGLGLGVAQARKAGQAARP